jgi:hypothetical protein
MTVSVRLRKIRGVGKGALSGSEARKGPGGLNFRDYSRFSRLQVGFTPRTMWYCTVLLPKILRLRVALAVNSNSNMPLACEAA